MKTQDLENLLKEYGQKADKELENIVKKEGIKFLNEPVWYHMGSGGKRMRPALAMITTKALGGNEKDCLGFALATELLHNGFLVHDDMEDGDKIRRDLPTVWVKYGNPNAINVGDYFYSKAYEALLETTVDAETLKKLILLFTKVFNEVVEGQALDINSRAKENFNIEDYYQIIRKKTESYLVFTLLGGAIVAKANDEVYNKIAELGKYIGPGFQIRDDIIDLTEGKGRGGEVGCDIWESKPSILYAYTLEKSDDETKKKFLKIMNTPREQKTQEQVNWIIKLYKEKGALEYAQKEANELTEKALKIMDEIPIENKEIFKEIINYITKRKK